MPIYYEGRLVKLHLINENIDRDFKEVTEGEEEEVKNTLEDKMRFRSTGRNQRKA